MLKIFGIELTPEQAADAIVECDICTAYHWGDDNPVGQMLSESATLEEQIRIDYLVRARGATA
jgi:hypothetical protein